MSDPRRFPECARSRRKSWSGGAGHARDRHRGLRRRWRRRPTAPAAANATARAEAHDLGRFLMRRDEEPGFRSGARVPERCLGTREPSPGVKALVKELHLTPADARRLRSEGFISLTVPADPRTRARPGSRTSSLYETAQGAKHSLAHELRPDVIRAAGPVESLRFFSVPGIPGARGWTASLRRAGEPPRRERPLGAGSVHARPREPGPRSLRRPIVAGRAGDL